MEIEVEDSNKRKTPDNSVGMEVIDEGPQTKVQKVDNIDEVDSNLAKESLPTNGALEEAVKAEAPNPSKITISFGDAQLADLYKSKFLQFINSFIELEISTQEGHTIEIIKDEDFDPDEWDVISENILGQESELDSSPSKKCKKKSKAKKELFVLDATPSPMNPEAHLKYTSKCMLVDGVEEEAIPEKERPSKMSCFNCDAFHSLKDCPEPKNFSRINAARSKFKSHTVKSRYHLEEEQKFSHLVPGKMSSELRKAMGLYDDEIPHFVYLMRKLGYPPGWLEEAKFVNSELDIFDSNGKNLKNSVKQCRGLDITKVVEFPGFNVPPEAGTKDDYRAYAVPPYSENFSKTAMVSFYEKQMDPEDVKPEEVPSEKAPIPESVDEEKSADSPLLVDLEQEKQKLLAELDADPDKDLLSVKTSSFGTPILKSASPYVKLPDADNFSKDVSPVINFENLPNSTGKYEQMTDVLQKVRTLKQQL